MNSTAVSIEHQQLPISKPNCSKPHLTFLLDVDLLCHDSKSRTERQGGYQSMKIVLILYYTLINILP